MGCRFTTQCGTVAVSVDKQRTLYVGKQMINPGSNANEASFGGWTLRAIPFEILGGGADWKKSRTRPHTFYFFADHPVLFFVTPPRHILLTPPRNILIYVNLWGKTLISPLKN